MNTFVKRVFFKSHDSSNSFEHDARMGDFVAAGQRRFLIFGDGAMPSKAALYRSIAVGLELILQQTRWKESFAHEKLATLRG
jgi:hypothetical protein